MLRLRLIGPDSASVVESPCATDYGHTLANGRGVFGAVEAGMKVQAEWRAEPSPEAMMLYVKDIMSVDVITVHPEIAYKEVVDLLIEHDIGGMPVVADDGALLGIVTETDLITKPAYGNEPRGLGTVIGAMLRGHHAAWLKKAAGLTAQDVMSTHVRTAEPREDLEEVARRLMKQGIGRLPVLDEEGRLIGIISRRDLLRQFHRADDEIAADVDNALHDPVTFESGHHVTSSVDEGIVTMTGTATYPHDIETFHSVVKAVPGVVRVHNEVTAELPEPRPEPINDFPDIYTRPGG